MWKNLTLLACSLLATLLVLEFATRLALSDITTTADNRSYFAEKWKRDNVRLNSQGFRDREFDARTSRDSYHVAFIGDSYTFGQGIAETDRMSNLLEGELRKGADRIQVLNLGNPGDNTRDELKVLVRMLPVVRPRFVLLQWFVNDVEGNHVAASGAIAPAASTVNRFKQSMRNLSAVYFLAAEGWHYLQDRLGASYANDLTRRFADPDSQNWRAAEQAFIEFIDTCRRQDVLVGVVLVPALALHENGTYPYLFLHERVLNLCRAHEVQCTDLMEVFRPYLTNRSIYRELWVNRFDPHMSPLANQLAAKHLAAIFGPTILSDARGSERLPAITDSNNPPGLPKDRAASR